MGRSPEDTLAVAAAAERAGIVSGVGYNYVFAPMVQHARRLIDGGRLGELTHYRGRFFSGYGRDPERGCCRGASSTSRRAAAPWLT